MTLMVLAAGKDIIAGQAPSARQGRTSVLILPVVGWVLKRTVLESPERRRVFIMIEKAIYAAASGIIWCGAVQMRRYRNYGLSLLAARLAIVPWVFSGFPFGFVFGFRALRQLRLPEIKAQFDATNQITKR